VSRVLRFLDIRADEGLLAAGLFGYSFLLGVGRVFVLTASQALFLEFYPASDLAYVYMIAALATVTTSAAYLRLGRRLSPRDLILANLAFTFVVTAVLRLLLGVTGSGWPAMATAAWFHALFALSSFAFWGAATQLVDIRQGKRLFPLATTGDVLAFSLGGFFILRTVDRIGTANLLWVGASGFALAVGALLYTIARSPGSLDRPPRRRGAREEARRVDWSSAYLRWMVAYFLLSAIVFVFLDNAFNDVAQRRFEGTAELARFFAMYSAVAAIINFLFRSLFAGRLVRRFGLVFGLAVLPAVVGVGAATVGLAGTLLPGLAVVFWVTVLTRMSDKVLRGVQYSSMATVYQPLMERGPAVQATMDGIVDSIAIGLAGVAILCLNALFEVTAVELSYVLVGLCAAWVVVARALKGEFVRVLGGVLVRRRLRGEALEALDDDALRVIEGQLESPHLEEVVYALDLVARVEPPDLVERLERLLLHPSDDVRLEALRHLEGRKGVPEERVAALAGDATAPAGVRAAALRVLAQLSDEVPDTVRGALESEVPELRRGAMAGLLRSGSIEAVVEAGAALLAALRSGDAAERALGAETLRDAALPSFYRQVAGLLDDPDPGVRVRAVEAAGATDHPSLWPRVVDALREPMLLPVASRVLLDAGPRAVPFLMAACEAAPEERTFRLAALRIVGLVGGEEAAGALAPLVSSTDREERSAVLTALVRCPIEEVDVPADTLAARLEVELAQTAGAYATLADLEDLAAGGGEAGEAAAALYRALEDEIQSGARRIFQILALSRPEADLMTAWESYSSGIRNRRAYALEVLDGHLRAEERARVFPVLDDLALDERLAALRRTRDLPSLPPARPAERLAADESLSSWMRLCARKVAAVLDAGPGPLGEDDERLFDRAIRLGRVELFRDLPGAALASVAPRLEKLTLAAETPVIRKGDPGDGMFVVIAGRVRVHDDGRELAVLGPDTVFGEFTVLQRSPRTASVTTLEPSTLVRLTQDDLQELMREHAAVARTLIRVILRRLRDNRARRGGAAAGTPGAAGADG